jgi:hypothetical protein
MNASYEMSRVAARRVDITGWSLFAAWGGLVAGLILGWLS